MSGGSNAPVLISKTGISSVSEVSSILARSGFEWTSNSEASVSGVVRGIEIRLARVVDKMYQIR